MALITRVEPGQLWFDDCGPVAVGGQASKLAQVGWSGNLVLARTGGTWRIVEVGNVYLSSPTRPGVPLASVW